MSDVYCKAPWTSVSYMPDGKYAPCCAWAGDKFGSREEMTEVVGGAFLRGEVPAQCRGSCPSDRAGWRSEFADFETDYKQHQIHFLDFRNNNLCNMKCRSCSPIFSSAWASEAKQNYIALHEAAPIDDMDLSQCKKVYFAGGEPLLNPQHYQVLEKIIAQGSCPVLMYSTNLSVLSYKNKHVRDLWPHFERINVHASIDAVGQHAESVRSGTVWQDIHNNLEWVRQQPNTLIRVATVISAINIWFLPELFKYFEWIDYPHLFDPVLANTSGTFGLESIPPKYRPELINMLANSKFNLDGSSAFSKNANIRRAIDTLVQDNYNETNWYKFLSQQLILDRTRNEQWFDLLPVGHEIYREALEIGQT